MCHEQIGGHNGRDYLGRVFVFTINSIKQFSFQTTLWNAKTFSNLHLCDS